MGFTMVLFATLFFYLSGFTFVDHAMLVLAMMVAVNTRNNALRDERSSIAAKETDVNRLSAGMVGIENLSHR
jgi:hypothetical protein